MKPVRIGIIGGKGNMGRWFENFFIQVGHSVQICDLDTDQTPEMLARSCNVILLSLPIQTAITMCKKIGPLLSPDQLLMDVCSLKTPILEAMLHDSPSQVMGVHPLFGPFTETIGGQNIIVCSGREGRLVQWMIALFKNYGAAVTFMEPQKHDRYMAIVQGLTHMITVSFARALEMLSVDPEESLLVATPVFRANMDLTARLFAQDLELYRTLMASNPHVEPVLEAYSAALNESRTKLLSGCNNSGLGYLESIRDFLGPFCQQGLDESNRMLRAIYQDETQESRKNDYQPCL